MNLDTPIKILLLDLPGLASSHSSVDHIYGSWTTLLLLFSPVHSSPSSRVSSTAVPLSSLPTLFAVTNNPLWHRNLQLHSKSLSITLTPFWVSLFAAFTPSVDHCHLLLHAFHEPQWIHNLPSDICLPFKPAILFLRYNGFSSPCELWRLIFYC